MFKLSVQISTWRMITHAKFQDHSLSIIDFTGDYQTCPMESDKLIWNLFNIKHIIKQIHPLG